MGWLCRVSVALMLLIAAPALGFVSNPSPEFSLGYGRGVGRRRASLLGSRPPSCRLKCGWCWPCVAVHVPIEAEMSIAAEYYPEAWRCKCRGKLFMP